MDRKENSKSMTIDIRAIKIGIKDPIYELHWALGASKEQENKECDFVRQSSSWLHQEGYVKDIVQDRRMG